MSKKNMKRKESEQNTAVKVAIVTGRVTIVVAIIGLFGTLMGLLFDFGPFVSWFNTAIPSSQVSTLTFTSTASLTMESAPIETNFTNPIATETITPLPFETEILTFTPVSSLSIGMQVRITANQTSGRSPLTVKLDARDSFLRAPDGTIFECSKGACNYTWYVFLNGEEFKKPQETRGTVEFKFEKKGTYFVSVYICHGSESPTCGNGGIAIFVE